METVGEDDYRFSGRGMPRALHARRALYRAARLEDMYFSLRHSGRYAGLFETRATPIYGRNLRAIANKPRGRLLSHPILANRGYARVCFRERR